jgi:hypothetical protein
MYLYYCFLLPTDCTLPCIFTFILFAACILPVFTVTFCLHCTCTCLPPTTYCLHSTCTYCYMMLAACLTACCLPVCACSYMYILLSASLPTVLCARIHRPTFRENKPKTLVFIGPKNSGTGVCTVYIFPIASFLLDFWLLLAWTYCCLLPWYTYYYLLRSY